MKTIVGGTETDTGLIAHLQLLTTYGMVDAPVRIVSGLKGEHGEPVAEIRSGRYVHALPGGGHCGGCMPALTRAGEEA